MSDILINQSVAILCDGNNIEEVYMKYLITKKQ
ncbi:MAG: hypothetical protein CM15mP64_7360 [Candidatus Neomarinimicrobiota bacterium]|nr:MAG: hypothetical protein CM15mP64_7360 [Candidatus Neomarinimicrobiota bacterium]